MASIAEFRFNRSLRQALAELSNDANLPDSEQFREALTSLRYFIPEVLREIHRECNFLGLDDIWPVAARKTGEGEAEIFGVCCEVQNQTLMPLHVHIQVAASDDGISWLECRLGERGQEGMVREPYHLLGAMIKRFRALDRRVDRIDWVYKATFGRRRL
ncbi:MAG: hypothetical protein K2X38_15480 [Gemmataceae bacterium]|nr:hypothetical protein [Gemmataceae bacterium]